MSTPENFSELINLNEKKEFQLNDDELDKILSKIEFNKTTVEDRLKKYVDLLNQEVNDTLDKGIIDLSGDIDVDSNSIYIALNEIKTGEVDKVIDKIEALIAQEDQLTDYVKGLLNTQQLLSNDLIAKIENAVTKYDNLPYLLKGPEIYKAKEKIVASIKQKDSNFARTGIEKEG